MLESIQYIFAPFIWLYAYLRPAELIWRMKTKNNMLPFLFGAILCVVSLPAIPIVGSQISHLFPAAEHAEFTNRELRILVGERTVQLFIGTVIFNWLVYLGFRVALASNKSLKDAP
jgi:hypothetical protein